jgi:predicted O-methyltransferase YrrM
VILDQTAVILDQEVFDYDEPALVFWLRHEAGSFIPDYFRASKRGGLELQQVPEEYAKLLLFFKGAKIGRYAELGIFHGGSFLVSAFFCGQALRVAHGVDCGPRIPAIGERLAALTRLRPLAQIEFFNERTDDFFKRPGLTYDCVFVDADHSYEAAKRDFENARRRIAPGGYIIMHDIACEPYCKDLIRLWREVKLPDSLEFIASNTCGIGVWRKP